MAIINCPHCGKTVSDTVRFCVHCNKRLIEEENGSGTEDYDNLSAREKTVLKSEFDRAYPKYAKYENMDAKFKTLSRASWACTIIGAVMAVAFSFSNLENTFILYGAIIGYIVFLASVVIDCVTPFLQKKYIKRYLLYLKKYQRWLKDEKNIEYKVTFNSAQTKWKKYFDEINIDIEGV